jgi:hypothetical protein
MKFLKKLWNWLLGQTTVDEKIEAKVVEVKKEVADVVKAVKVVTKETKDVVKMVKPKKSGTSTQITKSGASPKIVGSGTTTKLK